MLKSTVALVSGGAGCLGLATVKKLLSEGAKVLVFDKPEASSTVSEHIGKDAIFEGGCVTSEEDIKRALTRVKAEFGGYNVLINCAGVSYSRQMYNYNKSRSCLSDEFREMMDVNVLGTYNFCRLGVDLMSENKPDGDGLRGLLINTSGFYAFDGQIGQVGLSAAGGAVTSMTLPMCRDLAPIGIRVMTIAPGIMKSNLTFAIPSKVCDLLGVVTPNPKRLGLPEEYAQLVSAIIENKFLNGETIRLDGGMRLYLQT